MNKPKLISRLHIAGRTMRIFTDGQDANGAPRYFRTIKGKGWNMATLSSACNPYVLRENGRQGLRRAHPRATIHIDAIGVSNAERDQLARIFSDARVEALAALETYATPYALRAGREGLKITFESAEFFAETTTHKAHLRPLGFIGVY